MKLGRNDPCPCESGKKYKRCCLQLHDAARAEAHRQHQHPFDSVDDLMVEMDALDALSNRTNALIRGGQLDEAESCCRQLQRRYPDQIDALHRWAQLHEARGDRKLAAACFRKAIAFAQSKGGLDDSSLNWMRQEIARLTPEPVASP